MKVEITGNRKGRLCVFNCVDTPKGRKIADELLSRLEPLYEVHKVIHDGSKYEYEGLRYMQDLVEEMGRSCLYLHTKGAYNHPICSRMVRNLWKEQFGNKDNAERYFAIADGMRDTVVCPFSDESKITRYNGFVASYGAMYSLRVRGCLSEPNEDRMFFENMWKCNDEVNVIAMKYYGRLTHIHRILEEEYDK